MNGHTLTTMADVILCDEDGMPTGTLEAVTAHQGTGKLHKAFSIFVFSEEDELLLQRRSGQKMLFPLHWANTCCSHPREDEGLKTCAERRLEEEMGFTCELTEGPSFVYRAEDPEGRGTEHEYDTVLTGRVSKRNVHVQPNPDEVAETRWITMDELIIELDEDPESFAPWFPIALDALMNDD